MQEAPQEAQDGLYVLENSTAMRVKASQSWESHHSLELVL